ncbi:WD40-repeat-containing domain protein [Xylariaceae sp. FL0594]|nr:WD40-repeat-containing domain protein [Xylariaceae sp. FL0594]
MPDTFGEYPPNMAPQNALVVREQKLADHAVDAYRGDSIARQTLGPLDPSKGPSTALKRKNVLTGTAEETYISEHTFRSKHRAIEGKGGPERDYRSGVQVKEEAAKIRAGRQKKGDATIADGDGAYVGPWASYKKAEWEEIGEDEEIGSDEEVEYVYEDDEDVIESGQAISAPAAALARRKEVEELGDETTIFHGSQQYDYQGRTYMHVPQDLDVDLRKEVGSITNYIPKKLVHTWKHHGDKAVTALRFFPMSGHLLLSAGADSTVKIFDVYHNKELLRSYCGHSKSVTDISFNRDGTQFISGSFDRQMKVWDVETGQCLAKFSTGKTPNVIRFNPSVEHSTEFLAGMSDNKIVQYDTRASELVQEYDHHLNAINTITFVDDNRRFMTTSDDKSIRAWDYNIPVPIKYIAEPHMYPITRTALHPSQKYLACQSSDNQVLVYGATDKFRQNRKKSFRGHNNAGTAVDLAFSPDGQFLASGDSAGFVAFWDWKTCKMYHKLQAGDQAITCVQWHPQETSKVAAAGLDGVIRYWD